MIVIIVIIIIIIIVIVMMITTIGWNTIRTVSVSTSDCVLSLNRLV